MRSFFLFVSLLLVCAPACSGEVKPEKWQRDLRELERQLVERHVDPFHTVSREEFEAAVDDLEARIPDLTQPEILVGFAQLVARIGDGHTSLYPGNQKNKWFHLYPIILWSFPDGIYVIATSPEHANLFGKRLLAIDDTPIDEAFRRIATTIGADNEMEYVYTVPFGLKRPETGKGSGLESFIKPIRRVMDTRLDTRALHLSPGRIRKSVAASYDSAVPCPWTWRL